MISIDIYNNSSSSSTSINSTTTTTTTTTTTSSRSSSNSSSVRDAIAAAIDTLRAAAADIAGFQVEKSGMVYFK